MRFLLLVLRDILISIIILIIIRDKNEHIKELYSNSYRVNHQTTLIYIFGRIIIINEVTKPY